ncbi:MAG: Re/Si-specific NAD(P)(+) transhydrogenase subunit alpha [Gemmatimonadetes bacterium]|nr:Re/Si-specific NAD(P)(+) transhydrogenase subunit alpha [Gemmatimonadota bacterium]
MIVGVLKEIAAGERRVAIVPDTVSRMKKAGLDVMVEAGAGQGAAFADEAYRAAGANVVPEPARVWRESDVILKVQKPQANESDLLRSGSTLIGMFYPLANPELAGMLAQRRVTSFSLDLLPRITRAQGMDVLSAMSTVAGYKAVLIAAAASPRFFPMLVTAAGTLAPAKVLILGAGVAGLQAIATARRLGAVVQAFDVRPAAREQVESLGASFIAPEAVSTEGEGAGGYAKQLSEDQHKKELELIHQHIRDVDIVISTALIPGKPAPELITKAMVNDMKTGAVIVDLAAEAGGNCVLTKAGEDVKHNGVTIMGPLNLPATLPGHSSQMYARNLSAFLLHLVKDGKLALDFADEITKATCVTHDGQMVMKR